MDPERMARVTEMEERMNRVTSWLNSGEAQNEAVLQDVRCLEDYYRSPQWRADFEADEAGEFPADLPRGVLSEDGIDHLLEEYGERMRMTVPDNGSAETD